MSKCFKKYIENSSVHVSEQEIDTVKQFIRNEINLNQIGRAHV